MLTRFSPVKTNGLFFNTIGAHGCGPVMQISAYIAMIQSLTSEATDTRLQLKGPYQNIHTLH